MKESLLLDRRSVREVNEKIFKCEQNKKKKMAVVMCQRSPSKVSGLFIKISALFTANFRFVAVLYVPYLVASIFFDARLVRSNRLVKSNKIQQNVAKTGWELTKLARIGRSRSVYGQKRVESGVGQLSEPKLSVCCLRTSAHPFLAKDRPGAPVFGHCPYENPPCLCQADEKKANIRYILHPTQTNI